MWPSCVCIHLLLLHSILEGPPGLSSIAARMIDQKFIPALYI